MNAYLAPQGTRATEPKAHPWLGLLLVGALALAILLVGYGYLGKLRMDNDAKTAQLYERYGVVVK